MDPHSTNLIYVLLKSQKFSLMMTVKKWTRMNKQNALPLAVHLRISCLKTSKMKTSIKNLRIRSRRSIQTLKILKTLLPKARLLVVHLHLTQKIAKTRPIKKLPKREIWILLKNSKSTKCITFQLLESRILTLFEIAYEKTQSICTYSTVIRLK